MLIGYARVATDDQDTAFEERPVVQERLDLRLPQGRVEGLGPPRSTVAMAFQVAAIVFDEESLQLPPAEHVEAVLAVRVEAHKHANETVGWQFGWRSDRLRPGVASHVRKRADVELP